MKPVVPRRRRGGPCLLTNGEGKRLEVDVVAQVGCAARRWPLSGSKSVRMYGVKRAAGLLERVRRAEVADPSF
eukprot:11268466-Heterocapsa_arctica.AAC.1